MTVEVKIQSNWAQIGGSDFGKSIRTCIMKEDVFVRPLLDDVLDEERAILLGRPASNLEHCEVQMQIFPRFKVAAVTIVCSASKVEVFLGPCKEYFQTIYGVIMEEGSNCGDDAVPSSYRFDFEIERSGVTNLSLKFVSQSLNNEFCVFGTLLQVLPNPNGITTLLPKTINLEKVEGILESSGHKLSPNAEKCKQFMGLKKDIIFSKIPIKNSNTEESYQSTLDSNNRPEIDPALFESLTSYINAKFDETQNIFISRLEAFEAQQTAKLDKILVLLNKL